MASVVLLIHGFGGGVHEVEPLAAHLSSLGHKVVCPVLAGHSDTRKAMKEATWHEWIDSVERDLLASTEPFDEVTAIGFSMGGLIAFHLSQRHSFQRIATINTPIYYWNLRRVIANLAEDGKQRKLTNSRRYLQAGKNSPIMSMFQFLQLLHNVKPLISQIHCPILILQAEDDDTVKRKSAEFIKKQACSDQKTIKYFPRGGHLVLLSPQAGEVLECVESFLKT